MQAVSLPTHSRISDAGARALVHAVVDEGLLGVAFLRGRRREHVSVNPKYQALVGGSADILRRPFADLLPRERAPEALLRRVVEQGGPLVQREIPFSTNGVEHYVTLTYHRVDESGDSILVLAEDVTGYVHERIRAELLVELVADLLPKMDARAAVRSVVNRTQTALGATSSSLFVLADKTLLGAIGEWDWTRTGFTIPREDWPTADTALATGRSCYVTADEASGIEASWFESNGVSGVLCVPLRAAERPVGVLFFDFDVAHPPPAAAVVFAENVAAHCATALERALHKENKP